MEDPGSCRISMAPGRAAEREPSMAGRETKKLPPCKDCGGELLLKPSKDGRGPAAYVCRNCRLRYARSLVPIRGTADGGGPESGRPWSRQEGAAGGKDAAQRENGG